jgi:hypothetical protein
VSQAAIFAPMLALAGWTFAVMLLIPVYRFRAGFAGQVTYHDFKYGESDRVPPEVTIPNRAFMNLVQVPVLFYVVCLTMFLTQGVTAAFVGLAWAYFVLRVAHSLVHLSYNKVRHRLLVFGLSNVVVVVMWVQALIHVAR